MPQSLAQIYVHLIFSTKDREPIILESTRDDLRAYLGGILRELESPVVSIGVLADHVHIAYRHSKNRSVADTVEALKSGSSKWIKTKDPGLEAFRWQNGYAAFSVSASRLNAVKKYIAGQYEHHGTISFQDELRRFFAEYATEFDERYVWD